MVLKPETPEDQIQFSDKGYLICNQCNGYYELQENESPEDFEKCECGGSLNYHEPRTPVEDNLKSTRQHVFNKSPKSQGGYTTQNPLNKVKTETSTSENKRVVDRISPQEPVSDEALDTLIKDKGNLWDNVEEFRPENKKNEGTSDVIELNRMMMMVDQKRALEESNKNSSRISRKMGPIGFLGAAIVLLIAVLIITLAGEIF
jgi:hypothetical protein